jgi:hypothetical protein
MALRRFLRVGEGDFSFALAWTRFNARLAPPNTPIHPSSLMATSFDSEADLKQKYGHNGLNNVLGLRELGASVRHDIDATRLDEADFDCKFDVVAFNFPHAKVHLL